MTTRMMPQEVLIPLISTMNLYNGTRIVSAGTIMQETKSPRIKLFHLVRYLAKG